jgi:hypothetical protein
MVAKVAPTLDGLVAELEALQPGVKGEIIKGTLCTNPRPLARHMDIEGARIAGLRPPYHRGRGGPGDWRLRSPREAAFYAEIGVDRLWYVDADARTLTVSRLQGGQWLEVGVHGEGDTVHAPPFDAVAIDLAEWWGDAGASA